MSHDVAPLEPHEPVLRRIAKSPGYYNSQKAPPVERGAFTPNRADTDGLSLYLEREITAADLVAAANKPAGSYLVARLTVEDFLKFGFTVIRDMNPGDLPGHTLVPAINYRDYNDPSKNTKIKDAIVALAEIASKHIIYGLS
jgi:hypothetical protein